jgi:putative ABC transport system ATP-binding protein
MEPALSVRAITRSFGQGPGSVAALRGVDFDAHPGELVLLMGPSGSGKTTLLSIMGCLLRPSSGSVRVAGRDVTHFNEAQLPSVRLNHIGFVFQSFNLFPTLTAGENVELLLDLKGMPRARARERAARLLDQVGLGDRCSALPAELSGGQKQRVAIARALAGEATALLADEPTAALDSDTGRDIMHTLRTLAHERGRAVVIVTHDPRTLEFADRTVRMEDGLIVPTLNGGSPPNRYLAPARVGAASISKRRTKDQTS